jgi:hypothetical protein
MVPAVIVGFCSKIILQAKRKDEKNQAAAWHWSSCIFLLARAAHIFMIHLRMAANSYHQLKITDIIAETADAKHFWLCICMLPVS